MNNNTKLFAEELLLSLADTMAAAATMFSNNQHGYDTFISARDQFRQAVRDLFLQNTVGA